MSVPWLKNLVGIPVDEETMKVIPNPTAELIAHVTLKDIQAFGIIGTFIVGPVSALRRPETRNVLGIRRRMARCGLWGIALGCAAGPAMTYARMMTVHVDGVYDRCYRLRHNQGQVRVDRGSLIGLVAGSGLSIAVKKCPVFGGLVGMSAGVVSMALYNKSLEKGTEKVD
jgi:hypothetical protein